MDLNGDIFDDGIFHSNGNGLTTTPNTTDEIYKHKVKPKKTDTKEYKRYESSK